jgi:hypothetical protein
MMRSIILKKMSQSHKNWMVTHHLKINFLEKN